jgi:hypothetical protein
MIHIDIKVGGEVVSGVGIMEFDDCVSKGVEVTH